MKSIKRNHFLFHRKALISFNMLMWIPRMIFLVIVFFSIVFLTSNYAKVDIGTWQVESEVLAQRILYSPHGIAYYDPLSNRLYPGIVDVERLQNSFLLDTSLFYGKENKRIGAKIRVVNKRTNLKMGELVYNNRVYKRIAEKGVKGRGGVDVSEKEIYVLAKEGEKTIPATLKITVVVPRS